MVFVPLSRSGKTIQLQGNIKEHEAAYNALLASSINPHSAVEIIGTVKAKKASRKAPETPLRPWEEIEILVEEVKYLAEFPDDILVGEVAKYTPEQRHLELRFNTDLAARMRFRSRLTKHVHELLKGWTEVTTPILFKSTPEGAREFLVPTRNPGMAYALPQSPQQYKQILMASGVDRYYQIAHCFRDEDLRADRQPEFMQLDLEMAFASGEEVMKEVEGLVKGLWGYASASTGAGREGVEVAPLPWGRFSRMTYAEVMSRHGIDKPDLRIVDTISSIGQIVPTELKKMMSSIPAEEVVVEAFKFNLDASPKNIRALVSELMDSPEFRPFIENPAGPPGVFIFDQSKPLQGLQAFGHEGVEKLDQHFAIQDAKKRKRMERGELRQRAGVLQKELHELRTDINRGIAKWDAAADVKVELLQRVATALRPKEKDGETKAAAANATETTEAEAEELPDGFTPGDLLVTVPRAPGRFVGGSTPLGRLRSMVFKRAVEMGYMTLPGGFWPLWVTDFPLFSPIEDPASGEGQGGLAGFQSTHHPFTSPKEARDVDKLFTCPLDAIADHYDLVINGVELGGGSKRIHNSEMQQWIMREILKMKPERIDDFKHLFEALRAGCPPHAGLALGWDRVIATMLGKESIRDVLAFPKDGRGKDPMVGSPTLVTESQQETYHLNIIGHEPEVVGEVAAIVEGAEDTEKRVAEELKWEVKEDEVMVDRGLELDIEDADADEVAALEAEKHRI